MPTTTNEKPFPKTDLSGGMQRKSTKFLRRGNECDLAVNAVFGRIGGVEKILGMEKVGNTLTSVNNSTTTSTSTSTTSTSSSTSSSSTTTMA